MEESGTGKIGLVFFVGGPDTTPFYLRIRLFETLVEDINLRSYGDLNEILIGIYLDGSVYSWGFEGRKPVRLEHGPGRLSSSIGVPERVIFGSTEGASTEWLAESLTELFQAFALRLLKAKRPVDTAALLKDVLEAIELMKVLPTFPPRDGGGEVMARLRSYLRKRRDGEPVPELGWKEGYSMELDESSPVGIRFRSPFDECPTWRTCG